MSADLKPVFDATAAHRDKLDDVADLRKKLKVAVMASRLNALTIEEQAAEIRDLKAKLARVRPAIAQMFDAKLDVLIPTILIRDYCGKCGRRYMPGTLKFCTTCHEEISQRGVPCPFPQPLRDLIVDDITPKAWGEFIADVALGDAHLVERDGEFRIERKAQ